MLVAALGAEAPDLLELVGGQDGLVYEDAPAVLRRLVEEVLLRTQRHLERHDQLLAQGVDGRIVTCAKCCLKYENRSSGLSERTASGVSVPIDPSGSLPSLAIGERELPQVLYRTRKRAAARRGSMARDARPASRRGSFRWISPPPATSRTVAAGTTAS